MDQATKYAIAETRERGLDEIGKDELLLGCLREISRFGVVTLGPLMFDLQELGWTALAAPEDGRAKVSYSSGVVAMFDAAVLIARADGAENVLVEHLLVAFAGEESGLMGILKQQHGITNAGWRAAVAELGQRPAAATDSSPQEARPLDYLSPEQAAEALGIHVQTLRGYVRSGKLPAFRLAGERAIRIRRVDLERVLEPLVPLSLAGASEG